VTARNRSNLCVLLNSQVARILFQGGFCDKACEDEHNNEYSCSPDEQPKAIGVQLTNGRIILAKKEVVISAGAMNSPKLLMLSGVGPKKHLREMKIPVVKDLPVGQNLQDHFTYAGFFVELPSSVGLPPEINFTQLLEFYCPARLGPLGQIDNIVLNGFISTENGTYPDIQLIHLTLFQRDSYFLPEYLLKLGFNKVSADHITAVNYNATVMLIMPTLVTPKSNGSIKLASCSPHSHPIIDPGYLTDPAGKDIKTMLAGIRYLEKFISQPAFVNASLVNLKNPNCKQCKFGTNAYWKCMLRNFGTTLYHQSCTNKMGPCSDPEAVVDSDLRVHGIRGLRVIDASIMPRVVSCNTNWPTMAIAEKGADLIKDYYL
jgi:choline dehydrogenase